MPILRTIRKINVYEKENVYFQGFWPQVQNIFFCRLLANIQCLPLTKIKNQNIKVISDKKSVLSLKSKLMKLFLKN